MDQACKTCGGIGEVTTESDRTGWTRSGGYARCEICFGSGLVLIDPVLKILFRKQSEAEDRINAKIKEVVRNIEAQFKRPESQKEKKDGKK